MVIFKGKSLAVQKNQRAPEKPGARGLRFTGKATGLDDLGEHFPARFWRTGESARGRRCISGSGFVGKGQEAGVQKILETTGVGAALEKRRL